MEIVISRKLLESLKLEDLNDILSGLMEKLSSDKPVFLLADPANPNKLLSTSKAEYDKFIKKAVVDKQKLDTVPNVSGTNKIMKKSDWVRDIPVFRASENDILDEWIYVVEKLTTKNKVSYDALVEEATPYLKDRALRCYRICVIRET
ncbi:unnamed protein product [Brachionus calyciflorus]|uniref:Uncharacterized protein n=1 Tax=Brachionus calyciflorus TaxID=104777 RepID=A0A813YJ23_9BILA|nr:unnamed protein product [Brachionus calyciflorus]